MDTLKYSCTLKIVDEFLADRSVFALEYKISLALAGYFYLNSTIKY